MTSKNNQNAITNSSKRFELRVCVHQDDIVWGRIDLVAARRREEAELKRLIAASQKPCPPATKCDHEQPLKSHVFADGKVLKLYGCGCSNGAEILNGRKTMANKKDELENEIAKIQAEREVEAPRLADLKAAVVGALAAHDASPREAAAVCLNIMLQAFGHIFGEMKADILDDAISQVLAQLSDDPLAKKLFERTQGQQWVN